MLKYLSLFLLAFVSSSAWGYEGRGILNMVVVGEDYDIKDIKEIKGFSALAVKTQDDLSYILTLDGDTKLTHPDSGTVPTLVLCKGGTIVASVHLRVSHWEKHSELIMEWTAVPDFDESSYCLIQMYPNTENMVTMKVPFSAARVVKVDQDGQRQTTTLRELQKESANDRSDTTTGNDEVSPLTPKSQESQESDRVERECCRRQTGGPGYDPPLAAPARPPERQAACRPLASSASHECKRRIAQSSAG